MAVSGVYPPAAAASALDGGSNPIWSGILPDNLDTQDGSVVLNYNNPSSQSETLICTNFGFLLPSFAIVEGITIDIFGRNNNGTEANRVLNCKLTKDGTNAVGSTVAHPQNQGTNASTFWGQYGGDAALWGTAWTADEVNSTNFGVIITKANGTTAGVAIIDQVLIAVQYSLGGGGGWRIVRGYPYDIY